MFELPPANPDIPGRSVLVNLVSEMNRSHSLVAAERPKVPLSAQEFFFSAGFYCMGKLPLGKLLLGKLVTGEVSVGEISGRGNCCWGSCDWGNCVGEVALGK